MPERTDMAKMIADHMEGGFLENIIDMFRHDKGLFSLIGPLIGDERVRVRLGAVALVEELKEDFMQDVVSAIPDIAPALKGENPTVRADAAYLLGIIGHGDAIVFLKEALKDEDVQAVREAISEAMEGIG